MRLVLREAGGGLGGIAAVTGQRGQLALAVR